MPTTVELFGGTMMSPVPNPYPVYKRLRDEWPVALVDGIFGQHYLVTRYDDAMTVLRDAERFSSRANARGIGLVFGRTILEMDGVEHIRHRRLITPALTPRALTSGDLPEAIRSTAHDLVDRFAARGWAELVEEFTFLFPIRVFTQQFLQLPEEDAKQFHHWALDLISIADDPPRAFAAAQAIVDYLKPVLQQRRHDPGDDLISLLATARVDGEQLTDEEILSFCRLLVPAGAETTYRLLGSTLYALLTHPEALEAVTQNRGLLDRAIEETLRWESPVQYVSRETTAETELNGTVMRKGMMVSVALGSANRDERRYPDPDKFDLFRDTEGHLAFGFGRHYCAGSHLARLEARIALEVLLDRLADLARDRSFEDRVVGLAFRSPNALHVKYRTARMV
ncbi:MAG: cytochrome P450 [Candidatus Binatia bacterium]|nr:MAG: cytochrome P450 [Candidatus Binatia bacterium]